MIRAPYNFVPVSDKVYFPKWANEPNQITQDIPFSDGSSGYIDLSITNETPIFVRNGSAQGVDKDPSFNHIHGVKFIPATTIKGMIRSNLEILSFGKLKTDKNASFTLRDFNNLDYKGFIQNQTKILCGWLSLDPSKNRYVIRSCGAPLKINHQEIDQGFGDHIYEENFRKNNSLALEEKNRIASFKYTLRHLVPYSKNEIHEFEKTEDGRSVRMQPGGNLFGHLVFTGQPTRWEYPRAKGAKGKFYEYVFPDECIDTYEVDKTIMAHFKFIYQDSDDWRFIRKAMDYSELPVFFRLNGKDVIDMGLTYMYKLPYKYTPYTLLPPKHKEKKLDMSEAIFGCIDSDQFSLKGRVQFSHAIMTQGESMDPMSVLLNGPKASYYPNYLLQSGQKGIAINLDSYNIQTQIRGWKKYPLKSTYETNASNNIKLDTTITPVAKGARFASRVYYHNLREIELGALLSALTFHQTKGCFFQLGQGKSLGFGRIKMSVELHDDNQKKDLSDLLMKFEKEICDDLGIQWSREDLLNEFITLSSEVVDGLDKKFQHMLLKNDLGKNEFEEAKKAKEYLEQFSIIINKKLRINSFEQEIDQYNEVLKKDQLEAEIKAAEDRARREREEAAERNRIEKEEQEQRTENRKARGLSELEEKNLNGQYKVRTWNNVRDRVNQWLRKVNLLKIPSDQIPVLTEALKRIRVTEKPSVIMREKWDEFEHSNIWKTVGEWTNQSDAIEIFNRVKP